ncbi:glutamine-hydrolyzing GMP synthase [Caldanaerobacter subterraneus]|uniref:GMP synthase [glutamine-hydrolyzing] n=2 Tax=Caldanaerobacter subterraneus TaxID=911092 RepID=U5CIJ3_CALSX|nr:glutamine-hydrolyzing GMP synthase [Caldanaerobacter subterraneus]ERM92755.1 GMP synthase [Caldanaerobacter subterraneus subsp. yonseiensis KB-1]TCO67675.1 GMP synthase (glutamine-hydrolysing) [Caldanaerobacter subterraneus]
MGIKRETILILDFGGQYTQLIARRIREANVYCEIVPYDISPEEIKKIDPKGIVLSGGPASVYVKNAPKCDKEIFELGYPVLGICYGAQLMTELLGGRVAPAPVKEYGKTEVVINNTIPLFKGIERDTIVWMSHTDQIELPPPDFKVVASTENCPIAAIANVEKNLYGVQFHPEVSHTHRGTEIIRNFLFEVCDCSADWTMDSLIEQTVKEVRAKVGNHKAVCALSGGVDSAVAAVLVDRAIHDQLVCIFVDTGLLRTNEGDMVIETFRKNYDMNIIRVDAKERFLSRLKGVTDPEEKRKIIGNVFIEVFKEEAMKIGDVKFLVQGTLYPDVIESGHGISSTIKSHHNVGGLPEDIGFELIEPLRMLFKDEVRQVGKELGIPDEILYRQPFPGPGLAVRIVGEVTEEKLEILRLADSIVQREMKRFGWYNKVWQSFAILPGIKSVGVMGDERTYGYAIILRVVDSVDGMTADWTKLPYEILESISTSITNEVPGVNRVLYDITSKPPATIEWE